MSDQHDHLAQRIRELPDQPGIYIFKDAGGEGALRRQGEVAAQAGLLLSDAGSRAAPGRHGVRGGGPGVRGHRLGVRGAPPREQLDQAQAPAVQRPAAGRQDLPLPQADPSGASSRASPSPAASATTAASTSAPSCRGGWRARRSSWSRSCSRSGSAGSRSTARCRGRASTTTCTAASAPASAGLTTKLAYDEAVRAGAAFSLGAERAALKQLKREMWEAAEAMDYERAAQLRDTLRPRSRRSASGASSPRWRRRTWTSTASTSRGATPPWWSLVMRGGQVLDRRELFWEGVGHDHAGAAPAREVLPQIYDRTTFIPKEIHLPVADRGGGGAGRVAVARRRGRRSTSACPRGGPRRSGWRSPCTTPSWPTSAGSAAAARTRREPRRWSGISSWRSRRGAIEGFDISHFQGGETVASMVVWEEGRMRKSEYRSFNIRDLRQPDDFASMRQAVERRYRRVLEETGAMPDLILIDGGRGQLNAALAALAELGVEETSIVSLAKREEEIYVPGRPSRCAAARRRRPAPAPGDPRRGAPLRRLPPPRPALGPHPPQQARRAGRRRPPPPQAADPDLRQRPGGARRQAWRISRRRSVPRREDGSSRSSTRRRL